MSIRLTPIDLTGAVVGTSNTIDWQQTTGQSASSAHYGPQTIAGADDKAAHLFILNESPCELLIDMSTGETFVLPAGGWHSQELQPSTTSLTYTVDAVLAGALVNKLYTVWYAPHETPPRVPILGNSPIGGVVSNIIAQFLQGNGQTLFLTERDISGVAALTPGNAANAGIDLAANDSTGTPYAALQTIGGGIGPNGLEVQVNGELIVLSAALATQMIINGGSIVTYNNEATAGNGVPAIIGGQNNAVIASTALQTLIAYVTPSDGQKHFYRADVWMSIGNGTSGNAIAITLNYVDTTGAAASQFIPMWSNGTVLMNGVASIPNGRYVGMGITFGANPGTAVSITFRDPTNTPADRVSATLQRLI